MTVFIQKKEKKKNNFVSQVLFFLIHNFSKAMEEDEEIIDIGVDVGSDEDKE